MKTPKGLTIVYYDSAVLSSGHPTIDQTRVFSLLFSAHLILYLAASLTLSSLLQQLIISKFGCLAIDTCCSNNRGLTGEARMVTGSAVRVWAFFEHICGRSVTLV